MGRQGNLRFLAASQLILNQIHTQTNQTDLRHTFRQNYTRGNWVVLKMTFIKEFILFKGIVPCNLIFRNGNDIIHKQKWGLIGQ